MRNLARRWSTVISSPIASSTAVGLPPVAARRPHPRYVSRFGLPSNHGHNPVRIDEGEWSILANVRTATPCRGGETRLAGRDWERRGEYIFGPSANYAELLFARTLSLAHHIFRQFVGPQPEIDRLAQFALARPLREFDLGNQRGFDPGRIGLVLHFGRKG